MNSFIPSLFSSRSLAVSGLLLVSGNFFGIMDSNAGILNTIIVLGNTNRPSGKLFDVLKPFPDEFLNLLLLTSKPFILNLFKNMIANFERSFINVWITV